MSREMNSTVAAQLIKQANHERYAAASYKAMAYWCAANEYNGFAKFFHNQAEEELEHAEKFFDHLLDRGALPVVHAAAEPKNSFSSLLEVARLALHLEEVNSDGITACYEASLAEKDYPSQGLLCWFISEQVEEEAWANKMITLVKRNECPGALYALDRHIIKELSEEE